MSNEAYLLRLPPELCVRVASFLTTTELGPLRRSCKQIEANLFDSFASEFFTKRQFMLEHVSLEALLGIASHPGLASKLTEVIISSHVFQNHVPPGPGRLRRDVLLDTGLASDMLAQTFSKLPNLRHVGLRDYEAKGRIRDGRGASWKSWGWSANHGVCVTITHNVEALLPLVLSALGKAAARPDSIQAILRHSHLAPDSFVLPAPGLSANVVPVLQNIKTIFLPVSMAGALYQGAPGDPYDDDNEHEYTLRRFLHYVPQLENLRLNFEPNEYLAYRFLDWLGRRATTNTTPVDLAGPSITPVPLSNLTSLEIGMAFVAGPTLVQLLTKFDLTSFSLWKVSLQTSGPMNQSDAWMAFLQKLSTSLPSSSRLRSIMIGEARQTHWPTHPSGFGTQDDDALFVPAGTDPDKKFAAVNVKKVEYKQQYTAQTASAWLLELSTRTFVPSLHVDPSRPRRRSSDEDGIDDDSDEYVQEDEQDDEDMDDE